MLAFVTPTRRRWRWLQQQARALRPQLGPDDVWVIIIDADKPDGEVWDEVATLFMERLVVIDALYNRGSPGMKAANVARLRNAATQFVPRGANIVELDDHDIIANGAVDAINAAFADGAEYVFGDVHQQVIIDVPHEPGKKLLQPWEDLRRSYKADDFRDNRIEIIGPRAFTQDLWRKVGGWSHDMHPGGDMWFAANAEALGARIVHVPVFLATVTIDPESVMGQARTLEQVGNV